MLEGMGFWDYQNDEQLDRDNSNYVVHQNDREQMQQGAIRAAKIENKTIVSGLIPNREFMYLDGRADQAPLLPLEETLDLFSGENKSLPEQVRIPGTSMYIKIRQ